MNSFKKLRIYLLPVLALLVVFVGGATFGLALWRNLGMVREEIGEEKKKVETLQAKGDFLFGLEEAGLRRDAQASLLAIPADSSTLPVIATIRLLASNRGVVLNQFQVANSNQAGLDTVEIGVGLTGNLQALLAFIEDLKRYSPLMILTSEAITSSGSLATADIKVSSPWAPLPKELTKTDEPLPPLKSSEEQTISKIRDLSSFDQATILPAAPSGKTNPFSF